MVIELEEILETNLIDTRFESYIQTLEDEDLFGKTLRLDNTLSSGILTGSEALGLIALDRLKPCMFLEEHDGSKNKVIMLGSNSYLNLSTNKKIIKETKKALNKFGYGMGAVSNYAGITKMHKELENRIAKFYKTEDAIVFPSGYGTNLGVISAICSKNDVIINDSANHASIFDGCKLSGADIKIFPHRDMVALDRILSRIPKEKTGRLIITDGVFSMDGDVAPLDEIVELAKKYNCKIMVDDAHGIGIVGKTGRGSAEYYNVLDKIDLNVGMLSKTPGGLGGYCAGNRKLIQYLRLYARSYFFSTALPAHVAAGLIEAFKLMEADKAGRLELIKKTKYLKDKLLENGFIIKNGVSAIIPVMIYDENILFKMYKKLRLRGLYTNIVTYPAVRRKECRLRLCVMKDLTYKHLDRAVKILSETAKEFNLIRKSPF